MTGWLLKFSLFGICVAMLVSPSVARAGEKMTPDGTTTAATTEEEEAKNWIELGIGGNIIDGDEAQFKQEHRLSGDVFGGIQDLHFEHQIGEKTQVVVDGHAMFDLNDYDVKIDLSNPDVGYLRGGFTEFRSWYDGNGGWFPHHAVFFEPPIPEMHIDRGEAWIELGLRIKDWPEITLRYSHLWRQGEKDSTIWGDTSLTGLPTNSTRKIAPAYRDIDETRDIFALDIMKGFGDHSVTIGMRYEHDENDDKLQLVRGAGQLPPRVNPPGAQRFVTQADSTDGDMFSGHIFSESRIKDWFWFTAGYSYTALNNDLTGSRVVGPFYNAGINEPILTLQSNDHSIINLAGSAQSNEHVFNANILVIPAKDITLISGFRYTREDTESDSTYLDINTTGNVAPFTPANPQGGFHRTPPVPVSGDSSNELNRFSEQLELRYTGIENWFFYLEGQWENEFGNRKEHEVANGVDEGTEDKDLFLATQKYTVGANWYPASRISISAQYYYKIANYDNEFERRLNTSPVEDAEGEQRMVGQDWDMQDANIRLTVRPKVPAFLGTVALVTRYDFVQSSVSGKWAVAPVGAGASPTGVILGEERTGLIQNHMINQSVNWSPLPRLYFDANFSYVLSQTSTPVGSTRLITQGGSATGPFYPSPSVTDFRSDYWTISSGAGYVIDDKTDLRLQYNFYRAPDWFKNAAVGMPYGMGATEHNASISLTRELSKNMRLLLKYTYFNYADETFGGHNNYRAHSIYSGLQYRF